MSLEVLKVSNISKKFRDNVVLTNISFDIHQGECVALVGPNGAGKSVLINSILGHFPIYSGQISLFGENTLTQQSKQRVSVLFQEEYPVKKITVEESLHFYRAIYENPLSMAQIDELLQFTKEQKKKMIDQLSGGQRRLLSFVQCLIGQPDLLIFDEPTAGMDISIRQRFWEIINTLKQAGKTIIYTSHYIEEIESIADRILLIYKGKLLKDTTPYQIRKEQHQKIFTLPLKYRTELEKYVKDKFKIQRDTFSFSTYNPQIIWDILQKLNCPIEDIEMNNQSLLNSILESERGIEDENI